MVVQGATQAVKDNAFACPEERGSPKREVPPSGMSPETYRQIRAKAVPQQWSPSSHRRQSRTESEHLGDFPGEEGTKHMVCKLHHVFSWNGVVLLEGHVSQSPHSSMVIHIRV